MTEHYLPLSAESGTGAGDEAADPRCGALHVPTARICRLDVRHAGACAFVPPASL